MPNSANDEPQNLLAQLQELRVEHRDLDEALERLEETQAPHDELLLRRMKKRKLQLKDRIAIIERLLAEHPGYLSQRVVITADGRCWHGTLPIMV